MKLYILKARKDLPDNDNPWMPWYDKCFGIVVRAKTSKMARKIASEASSKYTEGSEAWLQTKYSSCKLLNSEGKEQVIIRDDHSA